MSNELITALEHRVTTAVDTIEGLRTEIRVLREERQHLEAKLRELLQKIDGVENGIAQGDSRPMEASSEAQPADYGFGTMGSGQSSTEY